MQAQDIFRKVIEAGFYGMGNRSDEYMCHALGHAEQAGTITGEECEFAQAAIDDYLGTLSGRISGHCPRVMYHALRRAFHDNTPAVHAADWAPVQGREFYLNWDQRPMP